MGIVKEIAILLKAVKFYGAESRMKLLLEEMSELQKEICKSWRGRGNTKEIAEEMADVEIMLSQVKLIFDIDDEVRAAKEEKLIRLDTNIEREIKIRKEEKRNEQNPVHLRSSY